MKRKQGKQSMSSDSEPIMLESLGSNTEPEPSVDAKCCISVPISARMVIVISVPLIFLLGLTIQALVLSIEHQRGSFIALTTVEQSIAISKFVNKMQIERGLTAVFISTNRTDFYSYNKLLSARGETEMEVSRLSNIPTIMVEEESTDSVMEMMDVIREHRTNADISQPIMTFEENIEFYTYINDQLLKATSRGLKVREEDRWLMAFSFLLSVGDIAGVQRALGASYFGTCILSKENKKWLTELIIRHETFLELAFTFHPESKEIYDSHIDDLLPVREEIDLVLRNLRNDSYSQACMQMLSMERNDKRSYYFDNMTIYIDKVALLVSGLAAELSSRFKNENTKATNDMALYIFIMVLVIISVLVTSYILYSFSSKMQSTTSSLKDTVLRLLVEKVRSDKILKGMPNAVVERILNDSPMMPQYFDNVTVYVSDVVGFADLANVLSQAQTLDLLHKLDCLFDEVVDHYGLYKVESNKTSFVITSGFPHRNGHEQALRIADLSLDLVDKVKGLEFTAAMEEPRVHIRIGLHTGSLTVGLIGSKMPRYYLLGETVDTASEMKNLSEADCIHVSSETWRILNKSGRYRGEKRTVTFSEELGSMTTYWLHGKMDD